MHKNKNHHEFAIVLILLLSFFIGSEITQFQRDVVPVKLRMFKIQADAKTELISQLLLELGAPKNQVERLTEASIFVASTTEIKEELLIALMKTESNFNIKAVGPNNWTGNNYKGLMQTPTATFIYADVDILHGARILQDKLRFAHGDLLLALAYYKGGDNPSAKQFARETLDLYNQLLIKQRERKDRILI